MEVTSNFEKGHSGSTIRTLLHGKINPKNWQVLNLGDVGFLLFFRVVSGDYGKPCHLIILKRSLWTTGNQTPIGQQLRFPSTQDMSFSAPRPRNSRPRPPANCPCAPSKRPRSSLPRPTGRVGQRWSRKIHEGFTGFLGELVLEKKICSCEQLMWPLMTFQMAVWLWMQHRLNTQMEVWSHLFLYHRRPFFWVSFMIIHQQASLSVLILMGGRWFCDFSSIDLQGGPKNLSINGKLCGHFKYREVSSVILFIFGHL